MTRTKIDINQWYERQARRFSRDTGLLAPGKDEPTAVAGDPEYDQQHRQEAWDKWIHSRQPHLDDVTLLWQWYGFRQEQDRSSDLLWRNPITGHEEMLPQIDLSSLYLHAIPPLQDKGHNVELYAFEHKGFRATVYAKVQEATGEFIEPATQVKHNDPALAVFWAVLDFIEDDIAFQMNKEAYEEAVADEHCDGGLDFFPLISP